MARSREFQGPRKGSHFCLNCYLPDREAAQVRDAISSIQVKNPLITTTDVVRHVFANFVRYAKQVDLDVIAEAIRESTKPQ